MVRLKSKKLENCCVVFIFKKIIIIKEFLIRFIGNNIIRV